MNFEIVVPISSDPINGMARNVKMTSFDWQPNESFIKLNTWARYDFPEKGQKHTSHIQDYQVQLVCDNDSIVDPKTGDFVLVNDDGIAQSKDAGGNHLTGVGQYDFYIGLAQQGPIDIIGLIKMLVLRADSLKRFDI